ncbi:MAG: hypothetical protein JO299_09570, partial [Gammaproteobacteria bacterium]|nr:hypothetical protein [Gammaproteobacteria bacterium]
MSGTVADMTASAPPAGTTLAAKAPGEVLIALVRREFWEHRALWLAPLVVAALLSLSPLLGHGELQLPPFTTAESRVALSTIVQWALWVPLS